MVQKNYRNAGKTYDERLQNAFTIGGELMLKNTKELHRRDLYLNRLIAFQDTEPVKSSQASAAAGNPVC